MKHILMACGTGICTSSLVRERVCRFLDAHGYAGRYDVTQCKMADVPELAGDHDFLIAVTLISGTLGIPYVNGVPFLTGADASASERTLLALMNAPSCTEAKVPCYA
ncbi:PTS sugar transporter subunit IIB [uncultured Parolsenella sp.]|uniref:PTS sugar transporter subunit IIB n=1 Tax=uncultured Parolsenella sp. TaxID=2083008 RepID=UPI0025F26B3B|nr:PTS sugar transporter subunit IIB [uncultured Parolsenella sp.]